MNANLVRIDVAQLHRVMGGSWLSEDHHDATDTDAGRQWELGYVASAVRNGWVSLWAINWQAARRREKAFKAAVRNGGLVGAIGQ